MVLCLNSRFDNNEALVNWELIALDVKRGVDYLKNTQKISKVIFLVTVVEDQRRPIIRPSPKKALPIARDPTSSPSATAAVLTVSRG